jgi:hypothetical protein
VSLIGPDHTRIIISKSIDVEMLQDCCSTSMVQALTFEAKTGSVAISALPVFDVPAGNYFP